MFLWAESLSISQWSRTTPSNKKQWYKWDAGVFFTAFQRMSCEWTKRSEWPHQGHEPVGKQTSSMWQKKPSLSLWNTLKTSCRRWNGIVHFHPVQSVSVVVTVTRAHFLTVAVIILEHVLQYTTLFIGIYRHYIMYRLCIIEWGSKRDDYT